MATIYTHRSYVASDVADAVDTLEKKLKEGLNAFQGKVWIIPSSDIHVGTGLHDLDVIVMGYLTDEYYIDEIAGYSDIQIKSFCMTIEVKSHGASGIYAEGTHLWVKYDNGDKDVTIQSHNQKTTLFRFFHDVLQYDEKRVPFVSNLIWLYGVDYADYASTINLPPANIITSDFNIEELFDAVGRTVKLKDQGFVDSFKGYSCSDIENIANIFCARSDGADAMTLRRLNILQSQSNVLNDIENNTAPVIVLSGHAGTGKTMMLLNAANMLTRKGYSCLFLTYNTALLSDLKHTVDIIKDRMVDIKMESMYSLLIRLLYSKGLWSAKSDIEKDFLPAVASLYRNIQSLSVDHNYQYVFVDEAQDWEAPIPEILKHVFKDSHLVIADGIDQFMCASEHTDWGKPYIPVLKKCLRQRRNLTIFAKIFASKMGVYWNVVPNDTLPGGRVLVYNVYEPAIHQQLLGSAKEHGCSEYDIMLLAPKSLVSDEGRFLPVDKYKSAGINLYDGIDKINRDKVYDAANAANKESRVYTYESCRGLEAWTTVCLRFHELFTHSHPHAYSDIEYTKARRYMLTLWTLIPLTRAVDTLVLIVKDGTEVSDILKEIAEENPDIVTYCRGN